MGNLGPISSMAKEKEAVVIVTVWYFSKKNLLTITRRVFILDEGSFFVFSIFLKRGHFGELNFDSLKRILSAVSPTLYVCVCLDYVCVCET